MGKLGILWELDAETGDYRNATDLGYQNVVDLDPRTVDGRQYVATPVGVGALAWSTIPRRLTPEVRRPDTDNGLYVFALAE